MAGFYSSVKINAMDIAPNYAGTCSALVNGLAAVSGIFSPYLIGLMTPDVSIFLCTFYVFHMLVYFNPNHYEKVQRKVVNPYLIL